MLLFLFFSLELNARIDSLQASLEQNPQLPIVLELNKCHLMMGEFDKGITFLKKYSGHFKPEENSILIFNIGDNYFFDGNILGARNEYLKLVSRYPGSGIANDVLERLYMIETARNDTTALKALAYSICLYRIEEFSACEDSLKHLIKRKIGAFAYYYLALLYMRKDDLPQALSSLKELNKSFPSHKIHNAVLLLAEIYLQLNDEKEARGILENLIVKAPASIYAVQARQMLKQISNP